MVTISNVALGNNPNVSPFTAWGNIDISTYVNQHGNPVSVLIVNDNSMTSVVAKYSPTSKAIYLFGSSAIEVTLKIVFRNV